MAYDTHAPPRRQENIPYNETRSYTKITWMNSRFQKLRSISFPDHTYLIMRQLRSHMHWEQKVQNEVKLRPWSCRLTGRTLSLCGKFKMTLIYNIVVLHTLYSPCHTHSPFIFYEILNLRSYCTKTSKMTPHYTYRKRSPR